MLALRVTAQGQLLPCDEKGFSCTWDLSDYRARKKWQVHKITATTFNKEGTQQALGEPLSRAKLLDLTHETPTDIIHITIKSLISAVAFSETNSYCAYAAQTGAVYLSKNTGEFRPVFFTHKNISHLLFHPLNPNYLVVAFQSGELGFYKLILWKNEEARIEEKWCEFKNLWPKVFRTLQFNGPECLITGASEGNIVYWQIKWEDKQCQLMNIVMGDQFTSDVTELQLQEAQGISTETLHVLKEKGAIVSMDNNEEYEEKTSLPFMGVEQISVLLSDVGFFKPRLQNTNNTLITSIITEDKPVVYHNKMTELSAPIATLSTKIDLLNDGKLENPPFKFFDYARWYHDGKLIFLSQDPEINVLQINNQYISKLKE